MFATHVRFRGDAMTGNNTNTRTNKIIARARLRRKKEQYKKMLRLVMSLLIVMTIATFTLSIRSFASDREAEIPSYKYYTTYTVQDGESLSAIAGRYITDEYSSMDKYIAEIVSINHLISSARIDAGQKLVLPYYSSELK